MISNIDVLSSDKIMQKLKEIKRTFGDEDATPNFDYMKSSDKLRRYLPESMGKLLVDNLELQGGLKQVNRQSITFRRALEQKLENLFDEEKKLLGNPNSVSVVTGGERLRAMSQYDSRNPSASQAHGSVTDSVNIRAMQEKIKQLENRYQQTTSVRPVARPPIPNKRTPNSSGVPEEIVNEVSQLRKELLSIQEVNKQLQQQIQRNKERSLEKKRAVERAEEMEHKLLSEIKSLKRDLAGLKLGINQDIKPKEKSAKTYSKETVIGLYNQIDDLKYQLGRQTKEKQVLQEKVVWLQQQLRAYINRSS